VSSKTTSLSKGSKGLAILFSGGKKFSRFFTPPYDSNTLFHDLVNWAFIIWNVLEKEGLGSRSPSNGSFNGPVVLLVISKMIPELIHFFSIFNTPWYLSVKKGVDLKFSSFINESIKDKTFFSNDCLTSAIKKAKDSKNNLHLLGLASPGGVHSHIEHLYALIELCNQYGVEPKLHLFTDGRDCAPEASLEYH